MTPAPVEFAPPRWGSVLATGVWAAGLFVGGLLLVRPGLDASTRLAGLVLVPIAAWCVRVYAGEAWRPHPWIRLDADGLHDRWRAGGALYSIAWADVAGATIEEMNFTGPVVMVTVRDPARLPPEGAEYWAQRQAEGVEPDPGLVPQFLLQPKRLGTTATELRDAIEGFLAAER